MTRGPITMAVGVAVCCCTCCPCGFFFPLDSKTTQVWVVDHGGTAVAPAQVGMSTPGGPHMVAPMPAAATAVAVTAPMEVLTVQCGGAGCGRVVEVNVPAAEVVQFQCPYCNATNQLKRQAGASAEKVIPLPSWWKLSPAPGQSTLVQAAQEDYKAIQQLVEKTFKAVTTRDRDYKKPPKRLEVVQVQHNCNPKSWRNYVLKRNAIASKMGENPRFTTRTSDVITEGKLSLGALETGVNEFLLFHGTKPSAIENICKSEFMVNLAGSGAGSLYGPGIYFGENSSKSDEYAKDDSSGIYAGLYAMLLCRVTCGRILYNDEVTPNGVGLAQRCVQGSFDSVLGDREKARGTFREFVVFGNDQAYPEYVIIYKRIEEGDAD